MVQDHRERGKPRESQVKGGGIMEGFLEEASERTKSLRAQGSKASIQGGKDKTEELGGVKGRQDWPCQEALQVYLIGNQAQICLGLGTPGRLSR